MFAQDFQNNDRSHAVKPTIYPVPRGPQYTPDTLMLQFKDGIDPSAVLADIQQRFGANALELCPGSSFTKGLYQIKTTPEQLQSVLTDLKNRAEVQFVEREGIYYPMIDTTQFGLGARDPKELHTRDHGLGALDPNDIEPCGPCFPCRENWVMTSVRGLVARRIDADRVEVTVAWTGSSTVAYKLEQTGPNRFELKMNLNSGYTCDYVDCERKFELTAAAGSNTIEIDTADGLQKLRLN